VKHKHQSLLVGLIVGLACLFVGADCFFIPNYQHCVCCCTTGVYGPSRTDLDYVTHYQRAMKIDIDESMAALMVSIYNMRLI